MASAWRRAIIETIEFICPEIKPRTIEFERFLHPLVEIAVRWIQIPRLDSYVAYSLALCKQYETTRLNMLQKQVLLLSAFLFSDRRHHGQKYNHLPFLCMVVFFNHSPGMQGELATISFAAELVAKDTKCGVLLDFLFQTRMNSCTAVYVFDAIHDMTVNQSTSTPIHQRNRILNYLFSLVTERREEFFVFDHEKRLNEIARALTYQFYKRNKWPQVCQLIQEYRMDTSLPNNFLLFLAVKEYLSTPSKQKKRKDEILFFLDHGAKWRDEDIFRVILSSPEQERAVDLVRLFLETDINPIERDLDHSLYCGKNRRGLLAMVSEKYVSSHDDGLAFLEEIVMLFLEHGTDAEHSIWVICSLILHDCSSIYRAIRLMNVFFEKQKDKLSQYLGRFLTRCTWSHNKDLFEYWWTKAQEINPDFQTFSDYKSCVDDAFTAYNRWANTFPLVHFMVGLNSTFESASRQVCARVLATVCPNAANHSVCWSSNRLQKHEEYLEMLASSDSTLSKLPERSLFFRNHILENCIDCVNHALSKWDVSLSPKEATDMFYEFVTNKLKTYCWRGKDVVPVLDVLRMFGAENIPETGKTALLFLLRNITEETLHHQVHTTLMVWLLKYGVYSNAEEDFLHVSVLNSAPLAFVKILLDYGAKMTEKAFELAFYNEKATPGLYDFYWQHTPLLVLQNVARYNQHWKSEWISMQTKERDQIIHVIQVLSECFSSSDSYSSLLLDVVLISVIVREADCLRMDIFKLL